MYVQIFGKYPVFNVSYADLLHVWWFQQHLEIFQIEN